MQKIKLNYWAGHKNFGDELSPYLVKKITGKEVVHAGQKDLDKLIALGSIIDFNNIYSRSHIWGSGVLAKDFISPYRLLPFSKIFRKNHFRSKVHATRGPLSRRVLEQLKFNCPEIYGDPGILIPRFYTPQNKNKNFKFGLILHQTHAVFIPQKLTDFESENIKIISIDREGDQGVESFLDEVCACDFIFSTSLHGIIVAQAYGIPAQWLKFKSLSIHRDDGFKFKDYFMGVNQEVQKPFVINSLNEEAINLLIKFNFKKSEEISDGGILLKAFPKEFLGV
nr:polysaccharide pyruvyl transferase family protein [uncultured Comamonas sp.]